MSLDGLVFSHSALVGTMSSSRCVRFQLTILLLAVIVSIKSFRSMGLGSRFIFYFVHASILVCDASRSQLSLWFATRNEVSLKEGKIFTLGKIEEDT